MKSFFKEKAQGFREYSIGTVIGIVLTTIAVFLYLAVDPLPALLDEPRITEDPSQNLFTDNGERSNEARVSLDEIHALEDLYAPSGTFAASSTIHGFVAILGAEESSKLLTQISELANSRRHVQMLETLGRRFSAIDPNLALSKISDLPAVQQRPFIGGIFREWAFLSIGDAIDSAKELKGANRTRALQEILRARNDLAREVRKEIGRELRNLDEALTLMGNEVVPELVEDPERAWERLVNDGVPDLYQLETFVRVAEMWVEIEGVDILARLSLGARDQLNGSVSDSVVAAISSSDPQAAFDFVRDLPQSKQSMLGAILAEWAETNPDAAINALSQIELDFHGNAIRGSFIANWVRRDPYEVLARIEQFPKSMQVQVGSAVIRRVAQTSPEEAVKLLENLDSVLRDTSSIAHTLVWRWAPQDPTAAAEWVLDEARLNNPHRSNMIQIVVDELIGVDPLRAFDVALQQPVRKFLGGMESDVINELCSRGNIELAMELLPQVREESRARAYGQVGSSLVRVAKTKQALSFGEDLPESIRARYYTSVAIEWADSNPLEMLEELPRVPEDQQSSMARQLANANKYDPILTDEQMAHVKTFLNEEDARRVDLWLSR